jgi:hypothetical protein
MHYSFSPNEEALAPLRFPNKKLRAKVIADYVRHAGYRGVVVFTCGNAAAALRESGLEVVEIGPRGDLKTEKWWNPSEIHRLHPDLFDATSGHLPACLMVEIGRAFREHLGDLPAGCYAVPTGSGETIMCLRAAYPDPAINFCAMYDNARPETERDPQNPLNKFVDALFSRYEPLYMRRLIPSRDNKPRS